MDSTYRVSMSRNQPFSQEEIGLPDVDLIDSSEQAFGKAFLSAAQVLYQDLEGIKSAVASVRDFTQEPFNLAILGLFTKMCKHYYSHALLEIHGDTTGSQLLVEHLSEAAVTLVYLVEEDSYFFSDYVVASAHQAHHLLVEVEELEQDRHPELVLLKDKLEICTKQQQGIEQSLTTRAETYSWGSQVANTTAKRGAVVGLNLLYNPARQIALKAMPASWLDIQLNYVNSFNKSRIKDKSNINFTCLRDAAYLCLHATQVFLEEVNNHQKANFLEMKYQQHLLNVLYEWFHKAHHVYQIHSSTISEKQDYDSR